MISVSNLMNRFRAEPPLEWNRLSIFHEYAPPPSGGGHQFMRALETEFKRRGLIIENNTLSRATPVCLFNSFNFDFKRLRRQRHTGCRMVHRVDGPIGVYRGFDDGTDRKIEAINRELADATIFQSHYSLLKHQELGLTFKVPVVIPNAPDPAIFSATGRRSLDPNGKIRLISVSWSDNTNKGAPVYQWLDEHLDWARYDYTFIGRSPVTFRNIRMIAPVASVDLARELREHDLYITASKNDPCSNSLLEALACGLPALYLNSGGHPEIAGEAGLSFTTPEEIIDLLKSISCNYTKFQSRIKLPSIANIASRYLEVFGLGANHGTQQT